VRPPPFAYAATPRGAVGYQVVGDGPVTLIVVPPLAQHIEKMWEQPAFWRPIARLAGSLRFVHYDKLGTGLSDPAEATSDIADRLHELSAVARAAGVERAWVLGMSEGGIIAIAAAARLGDLVDGLILVNTTSGGGCRRTSERRRARR
jgi:pimeloyl-ACP methyl ester carboxylesterase